jgi:hypothetical protein
LIAGSIAVGAGFAGGAHHAILLAGRLALIVCDIFAHLLPVFYLRSLVYVWSFRFFSDALAKIVWRAHAAIFFVRSMADAAIFAL